MSDLELTTIVMACPDGSRDDAHRRTRESLELSDVGDYVWYSQPPNRSAHEHWRKTHELAAMADTPLVLILEDDALVNQHIRHNALTWPAIHEETFGGGWLYNPAGFATSDHCYIGSPGSLFGTIAQLYWRPSLERFIALAVEAQFRRRRPLPWDQASHYAIERMGKKAWIHYPSLAEHPLDVPSYIGNSNTAPSAFRNRTSNGTFDRNWKRQ